jgi:hypothetical protein
VTPPERKPVFGGSGNWARFVESLRFLDEQVGAFYQWYLEHEAPRGTLLVITGDHPPHLSGDRRLHHKEIAHYDVPLIIHGIDSRDLSGRAAAHHDIPATILGLVGVPQGRCDQGVDVLSDDFPDRRVVYAVAGELEDVHFWFPDAHVHLDLVTHAADVTPPQAGDAAERRALDAYALVRDVNAHLQRTNGFAPPSPPLRVRAPLPRVQRPFFAAHRGQSRGTLPPERQNKRETIEQALRDGFRWIEVDVNLTRDQKPVLMHDNVSALTLAELRANDPGVLTLDEALALFGDRANFLVEIKQQGNVLLENLKITLYASAIVRTRKATTRIIWTAIRESPHRFCSIADARWRSMRRRGSSTRDGSTVAASGVDWIYVDHRQASEISSATRTARDCACSSSPSIR